MRNKSLSVMERNFVNNYSAHGDGARAARDAGYSAKTAATQASRLLKRVHVKRALAEIMHTATEKASIDAEFVLVKLKEILDRTMAEITPALDRRGKPMRDGDGNPVYKFDAANALRSLELLGKHVQVSAFSENIHVTDNTTIIEALQAGRRRVSGAVIDVEPAIEPDTSGELEAARRRASALPNPTKKGTD